MAKLKENSTILKSTGEEIIATVEDIPTKVSQLSNDEGYLTKGLTWNDLKGL